MNFEEADSTDTRWRQKEILILRQIEDELIHDLQKTKVLQYATASVWPEWDKEGELYFTAHDAADRIWTGLWNSTLPHLPIKKHDKARGEMQDMQARWEAKYGALGSPEVKEQERRLEEMLKRQALDARKSRAAQERIGRLQQQKSQTLYLTRTARRTDGGLRR